MVILRIFNVFPESVYLDGCEVVPIKAEKRTDVTLFPSGKWPLFPSIYAVDGGVDGRL